MSIISRLFFFTILLFCTGLAQAAEPPNSLPNNNLVEKLRELNDKRQKMLASPAIMPRPAPRPKAGQASCPECSYCTFTHGCYVPCQQQMNPCDAMPPNPDASTYFKLEVRDLCKQAGPDDGDTGDGCGDYCPDGV